jgi:hypothetical protein
MQAHVIKNLPAMLEFVEAPVMVGGKDGMGTISPMLRERAHRELKEVFIITFYLWVVFSLFVVYKSVVLAEQHIPFAYHGFAIINALALAKVMLVARHLHLGEQFDEAPLIYPTLLKSALFTVVLACFKILEDATVGLYHGKSFHRGVADLGGGTWKAVLTLTALLFVVLIPFFGFSELQRVLGEGKLAQLFFHPRPSENPAKQENPSTK